MHAKPALEVRNLQKHFPGVLAVDDVSMQIQEKEIHAIIGENGAGKSTLCKMFTGVYQPDAGSIYVGGEERVFKQPVDALHAGIGMVYQERNLVEHLNGAQNVCLGFEPKKGLFINEKQMMEKAEEIRRKLGIDVPLHVPVEQLGAGEQQLIEIMHAFYSQPRILILDEPTASLGEGEIEPFLQFVMKLKEEMGVSVIYITHKIEEIFAIADRVSVFTDGRKVMEAKIAETSQDECVRAMIRAGRMKTIDVKDKDTSTHKAVLEVSHISYGGKTYQVPFVTRQGEVVGFYGLVGSGRTETMEGIYGVRLAEGIEGTFLGEPLETSDAMQMIGKGMVLTPERRVFGVFSSLTLADNVCSLFIDQMGPKSHFYREDLARDFAKEVLQKNDVKYSGMGQSISELSGGNIQKVIIGRSVEVENLHLLVLDEPTAGMDLGAKSEIYLKIRQLADERDISIVFISSELEELIVVCDRLYVFADGNIVKEFVRKDFDKEKILSAAIRGGNE